MFSSPDNPGVQLAAILAAIIVGAYTSVAALSLEPRSWFTSYPQGGSSIGPFLAISWPIELTDEQEMLFSYYFEANFGLPTNVTQYYDNYTGDTRNTLSDVTRTRVYDLLENRLTREGYNGSACLHKFICELSSAPVLQSGLLSQLIHILLTPSSSEVEERLSSYSEAERRGSAGLECDREYSGCDTELTEVLPFWEEE
ncbi:hypothetical protein M8J76_008379 [Diaphorina citri]|nr:hypothetical protein M8J75_007082 [Diaphorina citri]KAI5722438.1 hypothetical protein M8J76_008379 [Diaphorina citri]